MKEVIIVGSGINGLVAANYLVKHGFNVSVIEKKPSRKWVDKKSQPRGNFFNKPKPTGDFFPKKPAPNRSFDIRKLAEERATKRIKSSKEENLQQKKKLLKWNLRRRMVGFTDLWVASGQKY